MSSNDVNFLNEFKKAIIVSIVAGAIGMSGTVLFMGLKVLQTIRDVSKNDVVQNEQIKVMNLQLVDHERRLIFIEANE